MVRLMVGGGGGYFGGGGGDIYWGVGSGGGGGSSYIHPSALYSVLLQANGVTSPKGELLGKYQGYIGNGGNSSNMFGNCGRHGVVLITFE